MSLTLVTVLAVLGGTMYAVLALCYKLGVTRQIETMELLTVVSMVAAVFSLVLAWPVLGDADWCFWTLALSAGITQYLMIKVINLALRYGPLSSLWSVVMLTFVPVIFFSAFYFDEKLTFWAVLSTIAAAIAVKFASAGAGDQSQPEKANEKSSFKQRLFYGLLLLGALGVNSFAALANKYLGCSYGNFQELSGIFMLGLYGGIVLGGVVEMGVRKMSPWRKKGFWPLVLLGCCGTLGGVICQNLVITAPAVLTFTVISSTSIFVCAIFGAFLFKEKRSAAWYGTICSALAAIVLSQGDAFLQMLR